MMEIAGKTAVPLRIDLLKKFGRRFNRLGDDFIVFSSSAEPIMRCCVSEFASPIEQITEYARQILAAQNQDVCRFSDNGSTLGVTLIEKNESVGAVVIDVGRGKERESLYAEELLKIMVENFHAAAKAEEQIEMVSAELAQTYEELVLLYKMSTNMKITESVSNYLQLACDSLTDLVNVEGIAILIERVVDGERRLVLTAGSGLIDIDQKMSDILYDRLAEQVRCGKEALLDSEVDAPFKFDWPQRVKSIIAVPLYGNEKMIGLMVAINCLDKADFDSIDVKLFNSVANECAVFIENGRLFTDLKELFIGSLKALTNSIDAKDQYTRGHSERVAYISRWIAEKYAQKQPLEDEVIHRIYLAGLLHDIGKIGIDEAVLRKNGALTDEEIRAIKSHPAIGANILADIRQMDDIVPGVLCHHERVDGRGYPYGLVGEKIPLIGKIVMVADSFDAMTSKRAYRNAMGLQKALSEIEKGLGTQFDEKIGKLFLESDVERLWQILQDGLVDSAGRGSFARYGTMAVGAMLR